MPRKSKKHSTPDHLDYLFERNVIYKSQYEDFWVGYWKNKAARRSDQKYADDFVSRHQLEIPFKKRSKSGTITKRRSVAQEQALQIGGHVVRVTKSGKQSVRGRYFRAIRITRKES